MQVFGKLDFVKLDKLLRRDFKAPGDAFHSVARAYQVNFLAGVLRHLDRFFLVKDMDGGADWRQGINFFHILVVHAHAAGRDSSADSPGVKGSVNAVALVGKGQPAGAKAWMRAGVLFRKYYIGRAEWEFLACRWPRGMFCNIVLAGKKSGFSSTC